MNNHVGQEIARQIGSRAFAMMGTGTDKWLDTNCLIFAIKGSSWKKVRVTLNSMDTYDVAFFKIGRAPSHTVTSKEVNGVYVDQLHAVIERETGLYLSL